MVEGLTTTAASGPDPAAEEADVGRTEPADGVAFEWEDLVVGYGDEEPVIDGASMTVPPGQVTALIGPNGSGKSTLLKGLADQLERQRGVVRIDGTRISEFGPKEFARKLGLLSQENTAPQSLTVERLVAHGRYPHRGLFESLSTEDREAVDEAIEVAGICHLRDRSVGSLSGGQRQLTWIAMALAQDTDVLLLDEPTTFLDPHHRLEVMEIIERLRDESEMTVILVLHDIERAARYADHVLALREGEIQSSGRPEAVITEDLLADVFRIDATVESLPDGLRVTPLRPRHE
jgi:iron complex transport system ATP-binding protein